MFWSRKLPQGGKQRPLLLVMEEAHNYLNDISNSASEIVQRIVKEGRKYGMGAMIVSQRPSEINQTILSQCGTIISMRLSNANDRGHVVNATSDNLAGLMGMLPILKTGEAIVIGEAVKMPMRISVNAPSEDRRPDSQDPIVVPKDKMSTEGWKHSSVILDRDYKNIIDSWRMQNPDM